jgi:hypothetical protein
LYVWLQLAERGEDMSAAPQPDPGAVSIAPADGYQYGDDHPWTGAEQTRLCVRLDKLMMSLDEPAEPAEDAL